MRERRLNDNGFSSPEECNGGRRPRHAMLAFHFRAVSGLDSGHSLGGRLVGRA